tara:strand:+ start:582 stop:1460 length:879 start_codon:yes stop_codon:yes gene_type:complete
MRLKRLFIKKTKKFIIKKLSNKFSILFQSFNLSERPYCDIPYVNIKFYKSSSLAKKGEIISLKIDGQILPKILETGTFDEFLYKFLKKKLKKNSLFIDVGSNHGLVSKQVSNIKYIKKIICFEPVKNIFELSKLNLKNIKNIRQYNFGWSKKKGNLSFYENPSNSGDFSLISNKQRGIKHIFKFKKANNELKKIIIKNKNLNLILKTDCQGYDIEIFNNLDDNCLKKIHIYFLECKDLTKNNRKKFYEKIKLFNKIFVSCLSKHNNTKSIEINEIQNYFKSKLEFDLILINK